MTNTNAPFGFAPVKPAGGGELRFGRYTIADGYNTGIFAGDPVALAGTGRNIAKSVADDSVPIGVFAGCEYQPAGDSNPVWSQYWPAGQAVLAGTKVVAHVYDDPMTVFEVQGDDGTWADGDIGSLADVTDTGGSVSTKQSGVVLKHSTLGVMSATTGTWRVVGFSERVGTGAGAYARLLVQPHLHGLTAGAGV